MLLTSESVFFGLVTYQEVHVKEEDCRNVTSLPSPLRGRTDTPDVVPLVPALTAPIALEMEDHWGYLAA